MLARQMIAISRKAKIARKARRHRRTQRSARMSLPIISSVQDPKVCTDEMMGKLIGCNAIARARHYRGDVDNCDCSDRLCSWDLCVEECQESDYRDGLAECEATYPMCADLEHESWQACSQDCADELASCVASLRCTNPTADISSCTSQQKLCLSGC